MAETDKKAQAPQSDSLPWLTWKKSTEELLSVILGGAWPTQWMPDGVRRFWGNDSRLATRVGERNGRYVVSTGRAGYLIFGQYLSMAIGRYQVQIHGSVGDNGTAGAYMDVALEEGDLTMVECPLHPPDEHGCIGSVQFSLHASANDLEVRVWVSEFSAVQISLIEIAPWRAEQQQDDVAAEDCVEGDSKTLDRLVLVSTQQEPDRATSLM